MEGLYKKVIRGVYPKIPSHYSQDLNNIIKELLNVQAQNRPDCGIYYISFINYDRLDIRDTICIEKNEFSTFSLGGRGKSSHVVNHQNSQKSTFSS